MVPERNEQACRISQLGGMAALQDVIQHGSLLVMRGYVSSSVCLVPEGRETSGRF